MEMETLKENQMIDRLPVLLENLALNRVAQRVGINLYCMRKDRCVEYPCPVISTLCQSLSNRWKCHGLSKKQ